MPVPVIVAIGHTQDRFMLQDLAWYGAKTPTDAAYRILQLLESREENIELTYDAILSISTDILLVRRENIDAWHKDIQAAASLALERMRLQVDAWYNTIVATSPKKLIQSGYALLMQQGDYLSEKQINELSVGDELEIQVYDQQFSAKIT